MRLRPASTKRSEKGTEKVPVPLVALAWRITTNNEARRPRAYGAAKGRKLLGIRPGAYGLRRTLLTRRWMNSGPGSAAEKQAVGHVEDRGDADRDRRGDEDPARRRRPPGAPDPR